ncbi:MAG: hypothetical protein RL266_575 [Bacteroidota bacterium]
MPRPTSLLLVLLIFGFASCELLHDEVYEEPITSLTYILTPDSGTTVVLQYLDGDGEGGRPALVSSGTLQPNSTYSGQLQLNTIGKHFIDSTSVAQEPELHQVFFLAQNGLRITTHYNDRDSNGFPVGLNSVLTTGTTSTGKLNLIIKHAPDKHANGVAEGDLTHAGGSTDLEVSFDVAIAQ